MASAPAYTAIDEPNPSALLESRRRWREPLDEPPQYFVENQSWRPGDPPAPPRRDPAGAKSETVAATGVQALHPVTDMEGLGEQVRNLKKELAAARAENRLLKVGKERAEIELRRAEYEGEQALKTNAIVDALASPASARRCASTSSSRRRTASCRSCSRARKRR